MRRISYWVLCTVSTLVLLVGFDASRHSNAVTSGSPPAVISSGQQSASSGATSSGGGTTNGSSSKTSTVTGDVVQTQWGPVQVQLVVRGGTITTVKVLQYPDENPRDVEIANYALPILIKETTQSQNAQIDMVSGATFTSDGYVQSLQSALDRANL